MRYPLDRRAKFRRPPARLTARPPDLPPRIGESGTGSMQPVEPGSTALSRLGPDAGAGPCVAAAGTANKSLIFRHLPARSAFLTGQLLSEVLGTGRGIGYSAVAAGRVWLSTPTIDTLLQLTDMQASAVFLRGDSALPACRPVLASGFGVSQGEMRPIGRSWRH